MENDTWVRAELVEQRGRPDKKVYSVTATGHAELARWIAEPLASRASTGSGLLADNRTRDLAVKVRAAAAATSPPSGQQAAALRAERAALLDTYRGFEKQQFPDPAALTGSICTSTWCCAARYPRRFFFKEARDRHGFPNCWRYCETYTQICCPRWISGSPRCATG